jgi:hypothetical protein
VNPIIEDIKAKIYEREENAILVFLGKVRKGKSLCSVHMGEIVDPNFDVEKNVVYEIEDFYKLINDPDMEQCTLVVEEMGVKADKRRFMSLQNTIISHTLQTFAHKRLCLILNCPSSSFLDSRLESMTDYKFIAKKAYKRKGLLKKTKFIVRKVQHNPNIGKTYIKRPFFHLRGKKTYINHMTLGVPDEDVIGRYKVRSVAYKNKLNVELAEKIEAQRQKMQNVVPKESEDSIIAKVLENVNDYAKMWRGKMHVSQSVLMRKFHLKASRAMNLANEINDRMEKLPLPGGS